MHDMHKLMGITIYAQSPDCIYCGVPATWTATWTARNGNSISVDMCQAHAREHWVVGWKSTPKRRVMS